MKKMSVVLKEQWEGYKSAAKNPGFYLGTLGAAGLLSNNPYATVLAFTAIDAIGAHFYYECFKQEIDSAISNYFGLPGKPVSNSEKIWPVLRKSEY